MSAERITVEQFCPRCHLVYLEAPPAVSGWSGVCPRCGTFAIDPTRKPAKATAPASATPAPAGAAA